MRTSCALKRRADKKQPIDWSSIKSDWTKSDWSTRKIAEWYQVSENAIRKRSKVEDYAYQLYLAVEDVDHTRTKTNSPQTNGICERFHRTIKDEFYDIAFRKKLYRSAEELQIDPDMWLAKYNEQRSHSGRYCYGKTPMQTFRETLHIASEKTIRTPDQSDRVQPILSHKS